MRVNSRSLCNNNNNNNLNPKDKEKKGSKKKIWNTHTQWNQEIFNHQQQSNNRHQNHALEFGNFPTTQKKNNAWSSYFGIQVPSHMN